MADTRCFASNLPIKWGDRVVAIPLVPAFVQDPGNPYDMERSFCPCGVPVRGTTDDFAQFEPDKEEEFLWDALERQTEELEPLWGKKLDRYSKNYRFLAKTPHFISQKPDNEIRAVILVYIHEDLYDAWMTDPDYVVRYLYERDKYGVDSGDKSLTYRMLREKALDAYYDLGDPAELWPLFVEDQYRMHDPDRDLLGELNDLSEESITKAKDSMENFMRTMKMLSDPIRSIVEGLCNRRGYARNLEPYLNRKLEGLERERFLDLHAMWMRMGSLGIPWNLPIMLVGDQPQMDMKWVNDQQKLMQKLHDEHIWEEDDDDVI